MTADTIDLYQFIQTIKREYSLKDEVIYDLGQILSSEADSVWWFKVIANINNNHQNVADYFTDNELFLSTEVDKNSLECLKLIRELLDYLNRSNKYNKPWVDEQYRNLEEKLNELKQTLHQELSYSHFEPNKVID